MLLYYTINEISRNTCKSSWEAITFKCLQKFIWYWLHELFKLIFLYLWTDVNQMDHNIRLFLRIIHAYNFNNKRHPANQFLFIFLNTRSSFLKWVEQFSFILKSSIKWTNTASIDVHNGEFSHSGPLKYYYPEQKQFICCKLYGVSVGAYYKLKYALYKNNLLS